jgi:hypothetical protein
MIYVNSFRDAVTMHYPLACFNMHEFVTKRARHGFR